MTTSKGTYALTSRKNVSEPGKSISDLAEKFQIFLVELLRFCFRIRIVKSKSSEFFLTPKHPLVVTFNERCAPTSRKYVAQQGIAMTDLSEKLKFLWLHTSVYAHQKQQLNLNFRSFLKSKTPFGGYFRGNVCTHFKKICI